MRDDAGRVRGVLGGGGIGGYIKMPDRRGRGHRGEEDRPVRKKDRSDTFAGKEQRACTEGQLAS